MFIFMAENVVTAQVESDDMKEGEAFCITDGFLLITDQREVEGLAPLVAVNPLIYAVVSC